jgi:hypothetical protein
MINRRDAIHRRRSALTEELALERAACQQRMRRDMELLKLVGAGMRAVNSQTGHPLLRAAALTGLTFAIALWRKKFARKQA